MSVPSFFLSFNLICFKHYELLHLLFETSYILSALWTFQRVSGIKQRRQTKYIGWMHQGSRWLFWKAGQKGKPILIKSSYFSIKALKLCAAPKYGYFLFEAGSILISIMLFAEYVDYPNINFDIITVDLLWFQVFELFTAHICHHILYLCYFYFLITTVY